MKIDSESLVHAFNFQVEVQGVLQMNILEIDTETGEATVYKQESGKFVREEGELVLEKVVFPVKDLHIYLVKPKVS